MSYPYPSAPIEKQPGLQEMSPSAPGFVPQGQMQGQPVQGQPVGQAHPGYGYGYGQPPAGPQGYGYGQPPAAPAGCPPGLEYLTSVDQLLVKQKVELLEAFTGFETANKYEVVNSMGQTVFYAAEDSNCCVRNCCGPNRCFDMTIMDNMQNEVIHLDRPCRCTSCWFPCCLQKVEVSAPPGTVIGYVKQKWSICHPYFAICDDTGASVLNIEGPICTWSCCGDVKFKVIAADGTQVGEVSKQWSGFAKEYFTDADNFGITFPMDLDVKCKATILGACFLIDFMFFEDSPGKKKNDAPGMMG